MAIFVDNLIIIIYVDRHILFKSNHRHEVNIFSFVSISQNIKSGLVYEYNLNFVF